MGLIFVQVEVADMFCEPADNWNCHQPLWDECKIYETIWNKSCVKWKFIESLNVVVVTYYSHIQSTQFCCQYKLKVSSDRTDYK